ncbi:MAG: exo-alpha-sialidase, partial [Planctomycetales bacterium]
DGKSFRPWVENLFDVGRPSEASLLFLKDTTCLCLLRRDGQPNAAMLGEAKPPYKKWTWKDLGVRVGGPHITQAPDGRILVAGRDYQSGTRTKLWMLSPDHAKLTDLLTLPSGGDTSYPGLAWHEGLLWVSYYSSHEGKTSIYLAKVRLNPPR